MTNVRIAPSMLAADWSQTGAEITAVVAAGADLIHLDVMDGHFVPNISYGAPYIRALRPLTDTPFDVHLMIAPADPYLADFAEAGADIITIHAEAGAHAHRSLRAIRALGCKAGIAVNPGTPVQAMEPLLGEFDLALVMTVNPGFGGQSFLPGCLNKVRTLSDWRARHGLEFDIEVDGGIDPATAPLALEAGVDIMVAGSAVFKGGPAAYRERIAALRG